MSHFISQGVNAIEDDRVILNHIIQQYPNEVSPVSEEVWDNLGEPSGKYEFMVKYSASLSSQITIEDITPTGWDIHLEEHMTFTNPDTFEEVEETPDNENDFLTQYPVPQNAQVSLEDIIPT